MVPTTGPSWVLFTVWPGGLQACPASFTSLHKALTLKARELVRRCLLIADSDLVNLHYSCFAYMC